jgi:hypothetical protein
MTIPLKQWCAEEAILDGVQPITIFHRLQRGWYPNLPLKRINKRVVLVELDKIKDWAGLGPHNDWL